MNRNSSRNFWALIYCLCVALIVYFSYALTDPNLVLSTWQPYWQWQQQMWQTWFVTNPQLYAAILAIIYIVWTSSYLLLLKFWPQQKVNHTNQGKLRPYVFLSVAVILLSFFAYNYNSHDVFNYIFNAKMILVYGQNPHTTTALEFSHDLWTRFMHNTHTPAPYGYGWTFISLPFYLLGINKFILTWLSFRLASYISWSILAIWLWQQAKTYENKKWLWALLFNPLLINEVFINMHNDLWMMTPAIISVSILANNKVSLAKIILSLALFLLSIAIKLATIALLPLLILLVVKNLIPKYKKQIITWWPILAAASMFLPLLTPRSKWFLPWYFIWVLVWLPYLASVNLSASSKKNNIFSLLTKLINLLPIWIATTASLLLLRYIPSIFWGETNTFIWYTEIAISFIVIVGTATVICFNHLLKKKHANI